MTFLLADRFASLTAGLFDANTTAAFRNAAIIVDALLSRDDILVSIQEIFNDVWLNFGLDKTTACMAIDALGDRGIVENVDTFICLNRLIKAEKTLAAFLASNTRGELSSDARCVIQFAIDNAAGLLNRPDFILDENQIRAIWAAFENRISILTGPPGSGKTALIALINVIASEIYCDEEFPCKGIALAGRAAANLREAALAQWHDRIVPMQASTIHSALKIGAGADEGPDDIRPGARIACGVLVIEEASMINSMLASAIVASSDVQHVLFVGDANQLQPIGAGKPFHDAIALSSRAARESERSERDSKMRRVPVTRLDRNYRTECEGIRELCEDVLACDEDTLGYQISSGSYEDLDGVSFKSCDRSAKAFEAGELFADFVLGKGSRAAREASVANGTTKDFDIHDVAILSPVNDGDGGTRAINAAVRNALGFTPHKIEAGDLLLVTENNYEAPNADGDDDDFVTIYNGERCLVSHAGPDFLELEFPQNSEGIARRVVMLTGAAMLPNGFSFGYAMSVHKAQGSQFRTVIMVTARGAKNVGIVQSSSIYTACSRAREHLVILGDMNEFVHAACTPEKQRRTYLETLAPKASPARPVMNALSFYKMFERVEG
jgi:ATP-dependent exoDNAse (exonuclease V) alpha subunit